MAEFSDVVRSRRMTRAFTAEPITEGLLEHLVDLASRAPSAGKTQGWHIVALEGAQTARFWDITLPASRRTQFAWQRLLNAPAVLLPFADPQAYVDRYAEPDKASTGLGAGPEAWPAPYWTIDASMAVMTLLLAAEDRGLGALFFGVFRGEDELRRSLGVPERLGLLGAIALGHPADEPERKGRSAARPRRRTGEIIHRGGW
ncbi:MAG: nitroreductase family protein [Ilumatobacter sp.]|uniref:nitroreductase family protein n=1 Tax=Ilumatobacter sp. TaxID=1967498 RepID=UPI00262AE71E|nr:nitroreductase family protein [Ilumatobacter sp.]MDJ0767532.1 nitroreductase family protein [Ilumatobacter sp.]